MTRAVYCTVCVQVYSEQIAKNFALIHSLEIPVSKEPTWIGDTMR